ncbi:MAG: DNA topoisomerase-3 [Myxococcota bacterium]|jgi:DNA topoisomerase-3
MQLVITEKPSVARDLAKVLGAGSRHNGWIEGNGLKITWCFGHMVELQDPAHYNPVWKRWEMDSLPMVPERFELKLREGVDEQWGVLCKLMRDREITEVINACDAGREGELIFRYVYQMAVCSLPARRLWVSSLTDSAIKGAWKQLKPASNYDALADAARCRGEADWLVGLNVTRAMTCLARSGGGDQLLSVGRVQTPTLAMIINRDREIAAFVPASFWQIKATFTAKVDVGDGAKEDGSWKATWFNPDNKTTDPADGKKKGKKGKSEEVPRAERLDSAEDAKLVIDAARGRLGVISSAQYKQTREQPPLLYDLTSLQRRANQRYGYSAQRTLQLAQDLYEKHKLISYPRTDARYITPDQVPELPNILKGLARLPVYAPYCTAISATPIRPGKRVVNAAEVGDHHALLPTGRTPSAHHLSPEEKRIFDLIARRFMAVLSEDALFDVTNLTTEISPDPAAPLPDTVRAPLRFRARGRICRREGWRAVDPPGKSKQIELPRVTRGDQATANPIKVTKGQTRPPRPHSDASLLRGMETAGRELDLDLEDAELKRAMRGAGLGTPATRAAIIQTLLNRQYIERKGRDILGTDRGRALVMAIPVDELLSAELTGRWESRLSSIADGTESRALFMADVARSLEGMIAAISVAKPPPAEVRDDLPVLGTCPVCGKSVREKRSVFECDGGRTCDFVIFKTISFRKISVRTVKTMLKSGKSPVLKRFKSRKGKMFSAALTLSEKGRVVFDFSEVPPDDGSSASTTSSAKAKPAKAKAAKPAKAKKPANTSTPTSPVGMLCPRCQQGRIIRGRRAWGCNRWREGCRYTLAFDEDGRPRTDAEAARLLQQALK